LGGAFLQFFQKFLPKPLDFPQWRLKKSRFFFKKGGNISGLKKETFVSPKSAYSQQVVFYYPQKGGRVYPTHIPPPLFLLARGGNLYRRREGPSERNYNNL